VGYVASALAAVAGSVFTPGGTAMTINRYKGCKFLLNLGGGTYGLFTVTANTATTITIAEGFGILGVLPATPAFWAMYSEALDPVKNSYEEGLSVIVKDGGLHGSSEFGFDAYDGGKNVVLSGGSDLSLNDTLGNYYEDVVTSLLAAENQVEIQVATDSFSGDPNDNRLRPANFAEIVDSISGNVLNLKCWRWNSIKTAHSGGGTGNGYVSLVTVRGVCAYKVNCLFTGAANYGITITDLEGNRLDNGTIPAGTVGVLTDLSNYGLASFTLTAGLVAFVATDELEIIVRPLPVSMLGTGLLPTRSGRLFFHAFPATYTGGGDTSLSAPIIANTVSSITVPLGTDLSSVVAKAAPTAITGTIAGPFNLAGAETLIFQIDDGSGLGGAITITQALIGLAVTAAALQVELELKDLGNDLIFTVDATDHIIVALNTATHPSWGPTASLKITVGTLNAIIGIANNTQTFGAAPSVVRAEWRQEFRNGVDGVANLVDSDYTGTILLPGPTNTLIETAIGTNNLGLVTCVMPGTEDTDLTTALETYCESKGYVGLVNIAQATLTEAAARAWVQAYLAGKRLIAPIFASYGYRNEHPFGGTADYLCSELGTIAGIFARMANSEGYHVAACGVKASLGSTWKRQITDTTPAGTPLEDGALNLAGIISVYHLGGAYYLWGDEAPGTAHLERVWWHKIRAILQILHDLKFQMRQFVYSPVTSEVLADVRRALDGRFVEYFNAGALVGNTPQQAYQIQCDESNNDMTGATGNINAEGYTIVIGTGKTIKLALGTSAMTATL
jgi:hypothetical protein